MKFAITVLALVATAELALGEPGYGPSYGSPKPLPPPYGYNRPQNAAPPNPAKHPPVPSGGYFNKNDVHSKYNPHGIGLQRGQPPQSPNFSRYPPGPPSAGKHQYQQQPQQHHHHHHPTITQQQHQQPPQHHGTPNFRPLGPQFQSKPHQFAANGAPPQGSAALEQRIQTTQQRPSPKITNIWSGPKLSGPPDFPRFTAPAPVTAAPVIAPVTQASFPVTQASFPVPVRVPFPEKSRPSYIINSDDERGPIKTIPAPNLNPADKPANFEEQLYRAQHPSPYVQPLDNTITDDKQSYQVTENTNKPYGPSSSYYNAQDANAQPHTAVDPTPVAAKVPLDVALQQHLEGQQLHQSQQQAAADALTPQELYSLLNGNAAAAGAVQVQPQQPAATFMVQQPVMYAIPQPQLQLDPLQYQPQTVQLQYAQQPAAVQLQYVQPQTAAVQYVQPQQALQYQPQQVQYEPLQQQVQYQQQQQQQQPTEQYEQQQQQQQQDEQQLENDVQYQRDQGDGGRYNDEPRNGGKAERDQNKFDSFRNQYYSAVPNEQTAGVLAQIAESAANNDAVTAEPSRADAAAAGAQETATAAARAAQPATEKAVADDDAAEKTSVQIQQSVPLYEGSSYSSSRRTNQEYVDDDDVTGQADDELMEGSETVQQTVPKVSPSSSVNGHAPSQFPYNAAKINAIAASD